MNLNEYLRQVRCQRCPWNAVWGPEELLAALRQLGMLRRDGQPAPQLILQLAEANAGRLHCQTCQQPGLQLAPWTDDFDDDQTVRACEVCGQPISPERLEVFPKATRCAACQDKPIARDEESFCPRCGSLWQVTLAGGTGVTRYRMVCPDCGFRR
jgi:hypothetical protein